MSRKWLTILGVIGVITVSQAMSTDIYAHGARIEYSSDIEIEIVARYDSGEPMAGAQVTVYAPDDPNNPWLTGVCDDEGRFSFVPDASISGIWDVQVRLAGHGDIVHIPIGTDTTTTDDSSGYSKIQIGLMAACVVWGSVGTALYFSRRRKA